MLMILIQILSTSFSRKFIEISVENFNLDNVGAYRVKGLFIVESALSISS